MRPSQQRRTLLLLLCQCRERRRHNSTLELFGRPTPTERLTGRATASQGPTTDEGPTPLTVVPWLPWRCCYSVSLDRAVLLLQCCIVGTAVSCANYQSVGSWHRLLARQPVTIVGADALTHLSARLLFLSLQGSMHCKSTTAVAAVAAHPLISRQESLKP